MNLKIVLLVVGVVVGGIIGWMTAPPAAAELQLGPLNVEVQEGSGEGGSVTATGEDGQIQVQIGQRSLLDDRNTRTVIFAVIGAIVGFGAGYVVDRRKV
jgi:F0F1-type ATP synthase assembly protein I